MITFRCAPDGFVQGAGLAFDEVSDDVIGDCEVLDFFGVEVSGAGRKT